MVVGCPCCGSRSFSRSGVDAEFFRLSNLKALAKLLNFQARATPTDA